MRCACTFIPRPYLPPVATLAWPRGSPSWPRNLRQRSELRHRVGYVAQLGPLCSGWRAVAVHRLWPTLTNRAARA